jgi:ribonuclease Z
VSIEHQVLGEPGRDNALLVRVWTGQANHRLLFDCGEGCLSTLSASEIRSIDALCFSHLHIDHVAGFDAFLRLNFARPDVPVLIFGPEGTTRAIHHRLRGVTWNLVAGQPGQFRVIDVLPDRMVTTRFLTAEAFEHAHPEGEIPFPGTVFEAEGFAVEARIMDHGIPCLAYAVRESPRLNIDTAAVAGLGFQPGHWMQALKDAARSDEAEVDVQGTTHRLGDLRARLLVSTPGSCVAYLTDFALDEGAGQELATMIRGCDVIVGEASYRDAEADLARKHRHFTGPQMGRLAAQVGARKLLLFHLSDRYTRDEWRELLAEVRQVFPAARFPSHWDLG